MQYNPDISIIENARINNVSEAAVRKYIRVNKIDRRHDEKAKKYNLIQKLREEHPELSARQIAKELKIAPATVCSYINGTNTDTLPEKKSARQANECLIFDTDKPIDFLRMERYDCSLIKVLAFSRADFNLNGYSIGLGNMRGFPIDFMGERFNSVEAAYVACNYGLNNEDCIRIQREVQALDNGWDCKKLYRENEIDEKHGRKDFHRSIWHFNLMLYLVWEKCKQHPEFCDMLLAIPDNVAIIENQSRMNKVKVGDWGCKNKEASKAYVKKKNELKREKVTKYEEKATILTMNTGVWEGMNHQGKILMMCRAALRKGVEPFIDFQTMNDAKIYLFGKLLTFNAHRSNLLLFDNQSFGRFTKDELLEICTSL